MRQDTLGGDTSGSPLGRNKLRLLEGQFTWRMTVNTLP